MSLIFYCLLVLRERYVMMWLGEELLTDWRFQVIAMKLPFREEACPLDNLEEKVLCVACVPVWIVGGYVGR